MTPLELAVVAVILAAGAAASVWQLRPVNGRHQRREQAAEAEADTFVAELRGLPDRFTPGVYLPRTPQSGDAAAMWQPPAYALAVVDKTYPPDELDKLKERFFAAMERGDRQPVVLPPPAWKAERMATDTDVRGHAAPDVAQNLCHCGKPAGHLAKDLAGDHPEAAFDTSTTTFEAVR
jgi:hypothetical protein